MMSSKRNTKKNRNKRISKVVSDVFKQYQQVLDQFKAATKVGDKRRFYNQLKELAATMIEKLETKCDETKPVCGTQLHEVCWLSEQDWAFNVNIPSQAAIQEDYAAMVDGINKVAAPIWRPNTKYFVEFAVKDTVNNDKAETFTYQYGFRTASTLGHYHNAPNVVYGNEYDLKTGALMNREDGKLSNPQQYPLTSLEQYIDYRRSYPNADGNLLQSKPLFYSGDAQLSLFYIKPYVAHFFKKKWDAYKGLDEISNDKINSNDYLPELNKDDYLPALKVFVLDPVSNEIVAHPMKDVDVTTTEEWVDDKDAPMPPVLKMLTNLLGEQKCTVVEQADTIIPKREFTTITLRDLKPRKMYTAIFTNTFKNVTQPVHTYVFQTSRYLNFAAQVNSYKLEVDEKDNIIAKAVFDIKINTTTEAINNAYKLLTATTSSNDEKEAAYVDFMDRVLEGTFKMAPLDPPATTEFNIIRNQSNNNIIALLIRNPEPFNDPKTPLEVIKDTIVMMAEDGKTEDPKYHTLYSKDYSQALIMHSSKKITADNLTIRFQYKLWNGAEYKEEATEIVKLALNLEN